MIAMPITLNGIDGVTYVLTETGENGSIQRQLITPSTRRIDRVAAGPEQDHPHRPDRRRAGGQQPGGIRRSADQVSPAAYRRLRQRRGLMRGQIVARRLLGSELVEQSSG